MASVQPPEAADHADVDFFGDPRLVADPACRRPCATTETAYRTLSKKCCSSKVRFKATFRLARKATTLGGVDIPAGTTLMLLPGAANRDPSHFACPAELRIDRPNARHNVAFARGVHSCPGGPLARIEGRVTIERILDRLNDIQLDEAQHGTADARRFHYVPLYIIRGLQELHLEFTTAS
jgi:hypothetical protein